MDLNEMLTQLGTLVREDLSDEEMNIMETIRNEMEQREQDASSARAELEAAKKARRDSLFRGKPGQYKKEEIEVDGEEKEPEPSREETIKIKDIYGKRSDL